MLFQHVTNIKIEVFILFFMPGHLKSRVNFIIPTLFNRTSPNQVLNGDMWPVATVLDNTTQDLHS